MEAIRHLKAQRVVGGPFVFATQTGKYLSYRKILAMRRRPLLVGPAGNVRYDLSFVDHSVAVPAEDFPDVVEADMADHAFERLTSTA